MRISPYVSPLKIPLENLGHGSLLKSTKIISYRELMKNPIEFKSQQDLLTESFAIDWFSYRRLISKASYELSKNEGTLRSCMEIEKNVIENKPHLLSKVYKLLLRFETEFEQVKNCMVKWMQNLNEQIPFNVWEYLLSTNLKFTKCQSLKEHWYKMFYRWYLTPKKISKMSNQYSNCCWKCKKRWLDLFSYVVDLWGGYEFLEKNTLLVTNNSKY